MSITPLLGLRHWCFKTLDKKNKKTPVTSKIYYEPEMTFGAKLATVVKSVRQVFLAEVNGIYYGCSKSSLEWPPGLRFSLSMHIFSLYSPSRCWIFFFFFFLSKSSHIPPKNGLASGQVCVTLRMKCTCPTQRPDARHPTQPIFHWNYRLLLLPNAKKSTHKK